MSIEEHDSGMASISSDANSSTSLNIDEDEIISLSDADYDDKSSLESMTSSKSGDKLTHSNKNITHEEEKEQILGEKNQKSTSSDSAVIDKSKSNFFDEAFALEEEYRSEIDENSSSPLLFKQKVHDNSSIKLYNDLQQPRYLIENNKFDEEEEILKNPYSNSDDEDDISTPIEFKTNYIKNDLHQNDDIPIVIERKPNNDYKAFDDENKVVNNRYDAAYAIENVECNSSIETQLSKLSDEDADDNSETEIECTMSDNTSMSAISHESNDEDGYDESDGSSYFIKAIPYDSSKFNDLDVSEELHDLFQCIDEYQPRDIQMEKIPLKCFIPSYIPAIGEIDACLKIPRPDGKPDGLGLNVIDYEPCSRDEQSDPAVLELKLRALSKKKRSSHSLEDDDTVVRSISNANSMNGRQDIMRWIKSIEDVHESSRSAPKVHFKEIMPSIETLMEPWCEQFETALIEKQVRIPDVNLDISLAEYAKILCTILDIPVHDNQSLIQSLHLMFSVYLGFESNEQLFPSHGGGASDGALGDSNSAMASKIEMTS